MQHSRVSGFRGIRVSSIKPHTETRAMPAIRFQVHILVLAGLLATVSSALQAADFCVANDSQLRVAMVTAGSNGQSDRIRIRTGFPLPQLSASAGVTYRLDIHDGASIEISGGWRDPGCTQQTLDPALTVLAPLGQRQLLAVEAWTQADPLPRVTLRNLSLTTYGHPVSGYSSCLANVSGHLDLLITRTIVSDARCPGSHLISLALDEGMFGMHNSQISYSEAYGALVRGRQYSGRYPSEVWISNSSFAFNTVHEGAGMVRIPAQDPSRFWLENSVVWGNDLVPNPDGSYFLFETGSAPGSQFRRNRLQADPSDWRLADSQQGNSIGDPKLRAQGLRLVPAADSPLRNAGAGSPRGGIATHDLAGDPRNHEGAIDIGAYEYQPPLFAEGFEDPID
jgi:hypothetical protein